ncbi:MAG: preprotein translocase subunit SecG [Magnetococcus sp. WYHC-3]
MSLILTVLHVLAALTLIFVVLIQKGSGADMGAAFGGSSQSVFGARGGGSFMGKLTGGVAALFLFTSLVLNILGKSSDPGLEIPQGQPQPAAASSAAPSTPETSDPAALPLLPKPPAPDAPAAAVAPAPGEKPIPLPEAPMAPAAPAAAPATAPAAPAAAPAGQ